MQKLLKMMERLVKYIPMYTRTLGKMLNNIAEKIIFPQLKNILLEKLISSIFS